VTAGKIALAIVLAGAIAAIAYLGLRSPGSSERPAPAIVQAPPPPPPVAETPAVIAPAPEPEPEIDPPPPIKRAPRPPAADTLAAERALLAKANAAMRAGDADGALAILAEHQQRFPRGVLIEERSAAKVLALCAANRPADGTKARDAVLARWPHSVHATRVQAACSR
jgi:hypothetical protein